MDKTYILLLAVIVALPLAQAELLMPAPTGEVDLRIAEWYPQGNDYVFICEPQNFTALSYDWHFGDGQHLYGVMNDNIYHTFATGGAYNVTCVAHGEITGTATLEVTVGDVPEPPNGSCYDNLEDIPATCDGGTIELDTFDGACRRIICMNREEGALAMACEKPDEGEKTGFEMYLLSKNGVAVERICLGDVCVDGNGFMAASYPVCTNGTIEPPEPTATLSIAPWYPQGNDYVFICDAGFAATSYDWHFGDGQHLFDVTNGDVFHTYTGEGTYEVSCVAYGDGVGAADMMVVTVGDGEPPIPPGDLCFDSLEDIPATCTGGVISSDVFDGSCRTIVCVGADGNDQVLACEKPDEGTKTSFEAYLQIDGSSDVSSICIGGNCVDGNGFVSATYPVCTGEEPPEPPVNETGLELSIAPWYPQGQDYVFQCEASGFEPATYDWQFGDGEFLLEVINDNIFHTYSAPGSYNVSCAAGGEETTLEVVVGATPELT